MDEHKKNIIRCQKLINRLLTALNLKFEPAEQATEEGWYVWRNNPQWDIDSYTVVEFADGKMYESEPVDSWGAVWAMSEVKPHGELAGPIIGR